LCRECAAIPIPQPREPYGDLTAWKDAVEKLPEPARKYIRPGDHPFNMPMLAEARMASEHYREADGPLFEDAGTLMLESVLRSQIRQLGKGLEDIMTPKERYLAYHKSCCDKLVEITAKKNADYTGTDPDPFANFTRVESLGIASTEQGFLTRMVDKLCRISSYVQKGTLQVNDESVEDTLLDLANYSILLAGYIKSKKEKV
jgi:hypothetical protein